MVFIVQFHMQKQVRLYSKTYFIMPDKMCLFINSVIYIVVQIAVVVVDLLDWCLFDVVRQILMQHKMRYIPIYQ